MKIITFAVPLALGALLAACGDRPAAAPGPSSQASSPMVTAPVSTPSPVPPAPTAPAAPDTTAQDTPANNPTGTLTQEEESSGMPKAGQANNHSSPSLEKTK